MYSGGGEGYRRGIGGKQFGDRRWEVTWLWRLFDAGGVTISVIVLDLLLETFGSRERTE